MPELCFVVVLACLLASRCFSFPCVEYISIPKQSAVRENTLKSVHPHLL